MVDFGAIGISRNTPAQKFDTTRREAPFALPWADWDYLRLSGYLHDVFSTVICLDMGGACPLSELFDLAQSQSQKPPRIGSGG